MPGPFITERLLMGHKESNQTNKISHACITGQSNLEKAALLCLQMIEDTLVKEDYFVAMVRESGSPILATPMDRLLLGINPKTGKADYIVTIAK